MRRDRLWVVVCVALLAALLIAYAIVQQSLTLPLLVALLRLCIDMLAVVSLMIVGGTVGTLIMPDLPRLHELIQTVLRALVGLGILSLLILLFGLLGLFPPQWLAWAATIILLIALRRPARQWIQQIRDLIGLPFTHVPDPMTRWTRRAILILLGISLIGAMAPPTVWDALTYHLAGPQHYLDVGRIAAFPENHFLGFPELTEMLNLWVLILARPQAATLLHWCFGVLTILMLIGFGRQIRRPSAGWIAAAVLLAGFSFWSAFTWPYSDLATTAYITGAVMLLLAAAEIGPSRRAPFFPWIGVMAGLAMGTKYTAAGSTVGIAALTLWITRDEPIRLRFQRLAIVAGTALLVFSPWLLKNTLLYRNPVAPFLLGTTHFDALDQWYYLRPGTGLTVSQLFMLPIEATVYGQEGRSPYSASIGSLIFGLLPLAFAAWRRRDVSDRTAILGCLVFALPAYLIWLAGTGTSLFLVQMRLLFPIFPALALIGALAIEGLFHIPKLADLARLLRFAVFAALALNLYAVVVFMTRLAPLPVMLGLQSESDYLYAHLGAPYAAIQQIRMLPEESRVLMLWEPRSFGCGERCIPDSMINQWWHDRQTHGDAANIIDHWRSQGYTHILIFEHGWQFLQAEDNLNEPLTDADFAELENARSLMTQIWDGFGAYALYVLGDASQ